MPQSASPCSASPGVSINVRSAYYAYGECVAGEGLYFGDSEVCTIRQLDARRYRLHFSPNDKGLLVSSALMLLQKGA